MNSISGRERRPLAGQGAIITGAARGIRRATAVAFARAGADVMGIDNGAL
jgi:NAD(P)-dependent dehydrogenase (short-subunit alcohol dehydrogenase family)